MLVFLCVTNLSALAFYRLPLPSPLPGLAVATSMMVVVGEVQELLLAWEEELIRSEEALASWEEKARVLDNALAKVSAGLDAERTKAEVTRKEYLDKMVAHTAHAKHSIGLDQMLVEKKVDLNGREGDLNLCEAELAEAQTWGQNPQDNREELLEVIELWRLLQDAEADHVVEARLLSTLVRDVVKVLEDLGMPPIQGIPRDLCTTDDVLEVVDIIPEHRQEAYASGHGPWD
jgi:hypothetical protein